MSIPRLLCVCALLGCALVVAAPARAQEDWRVSVSLPLVFQLVEDPQAPDPPLERRPSGVHVAVTTPLGLGVGLAHFRAGFAEQAFPWAGRDIAFDLLEALYGASFDETWLALGVGLGGVEFAPVTATEGQITQDFRASDARTLFVLLSQRVATHWELLFGAHLLRAKVRLVTNGVEASGTLEAELFSLGANVRF